MRSLVLLWDPRNPIVPVAPVVEALKALPDLKVIECTFQELGHPTLPNGRYELSGLLAGHSPQGLLWIEGGPLPGDLKSIPCPKGAWFVNSHLEPDLGTDLGVDFDFWFTASLRATSDEKARWLPLSADSSEDRAPLPGLSVLLSDPEPPGHARARGILARLAMEVDEPSVPVTLCLGVGGEVHPKLFDCLRLGAAVVVDQDSDLRGVGRVGEHLERVTEGQDISMFMRNLIQDDERLRRLALRGREIVEHLHAPELRAQRIVDAYWPSRRVLSGEKSAPQISILVTCFHYLRRLKVCIESLARQELPPGYLEVVVADPGSPDGLGAWLEDFALKHPSIRVVHLPLDPIYRRNRGVGINRAFEASRGQVIISIDGDVVFPPHLIQTLFNHVESAPDQVFGVRRVFLPQEVTEQVLAGQIDPFAGFDNLARMDGDGEDHAYVGVLGYCQAVQRSAFARARYPEEFDMVNQSDIIFVERLTKWAGVRPKYLEEHAVLHLWHPRNWNGTNDPL